MLCAVYHECSLFSHASPPLNPAHAQYTKYKCQNRSNTAGYHEQHMYLIHPLLSQQQVSDCSAGAYYE